MIIPLLLATN
jgi:nitrate/nitrite-specific signal transduction histidine kinase